MVKPLDRKLLRDLGRLKGQVLTIALVVASGIAAFIAMRGNYVSLTLARDAYYERTRFADVFARVERAPQSLRSQLEAIDGVARVHTRVVEGAMLPLPDMPEPVKGVVVSLPSSGRAPMNQLHLVSGRSVEGGHSDEVVLLHAFAEVHGIAPGAELPAVINGTWRMLRVVGTAMSPEYVLPISGADLAADPKRFAVLWMDRGAVAAAFQMEGAFNDLNIKLQPGASRPKIIDALDRVLERYGGLGAHARDKQLSNRTIDGELLQLESMSTVVPAIFLAVAALLLNIVLSRLVHLQRPDVATLKAVGYSDREVGLHFFKLVLIIGALGAVIGLALGSWLGDGLVKLYGEYFKFPDLRFRLDASAALTAVAISFGAAGFGAFGAVRKVVSLPPAEAMRPASPANYRRSLVDVLGLTRVVGPSLHMIVRELERRPLRTIASSFAISASVGLMVVGGWYQEGLDALMYTQFHEVMREDLLVAFNKTRPERAVRELAHIPGVLQAEGLRMVPVRFRSGHRNRDGAIWGYPHDGDMRTLRDRFGHRVPLPPDGIVLTDVLAELLRLKVGDTVQLEVREGARPTIEVTVSGLVDESFGLQGHMGADVLRSMLGEEPRVSMGLLRIDPLKARSIDTRLKDMPYVASVTRRSDILDRFREQSGKMIWTMTLIITLFAATITVGVVYNNARIALSLRARDLASLRVLGFHRSEISAILLGEMAVQVMLALPIGLWFGHWLIQGIASTVDPETYRLPIIVTGRSYAYAALVALAASAFSALLVRRKIDKLDLIAVLKTRE